MYWKAFVCLCRRILNSMHTIFNTVHSVSDMNSTYKFQDISRIFTKVRACTDGQTNSKTDKPKA